MTTFVLLFSLFSFEWPEPEAPDRFRGLEPAQFVSTRVGELRDANLREASGLAVSRRSPQLLWAHNDSGWGPILYAVGPKGQGRGRVKVLETSDEDWEDMASFELDGKPYLLVADVGDNRAKRRMVWLHVIEEPELDGPMTEVKPAWSIAVRYPDGPADCEAVAVDTDRREALLLTKRQKPPRLYRVSIDDGRVGGRHAPLRTAELVAEVSNIPPPDSTDLVEDPLFGAWRSQPTSMDMSADGRQIVVLTYRHAYLYRRATGQSWSEAFAIAPEIVLLPRMRQPEAIAFGSDASTIFVTTEKKPSPLFKLTADIKGGKKQ